MHKTRIMNKKAKTSSGMTFNKTPRSLALPSIKKYNSMVERSVNMTFLIPLFNS